MAMILTAAPAGEPVTLAEAKAHLRVVTDDEDTLVTSLITAARIHIETGLARALVTQSWTLILDAWPGPAVTLPLAPLQSVGEVRVHDAEGAASVVAPEDYFVDAASVPARIVRKRAANWPAPGQVANGIEIDFTAGYGATPSSVPLPLRLAVLMLVAHWFENREPVLVGAPPEPVPLGVGALVAPYRAARL